MGYYTRYSLTDQGGRNRQQDFRDWMKNALHENFDPFADEIKWYDHTDHMVQFSYDYPDETFILEGIGEEQDDHWKLWVRNGYTCLVKPRVEWPVPLMGEYKKSALPRIKKASAASILESLRAGREISYHELVAIEAVVIDGTEFKTKTLVGHLVIDVGLGVTVQFPAGSLKRVSEVKLKASPKK